MKRANYEKRLAKLEARFLPPPPDPPEVVAQQQELLLRLRQLRQRYLALTDPDLFDDESL